MTTSAIALGSNLGDRLACLRAAVVGLGQLGRVVGVSSLYETAPVGGPEQGPYLNAVVTLETDIEPEELLRRTQAIERDARRIRAVRWGPRTLDLDLIFYGDRIVDVPGLTVPHPRYAERRFVLVPLMEVWPEPRGPDGVDLAAAAARLTDQELTPVAGPDWAEPDPPRPDRGGGWVAAQAVLFLALGILTLATPWSIPLPAGVVLPLGAAAVAAATAQGLAGSRRLGRFLTPFPEPVPGGALVTSGVYELVRHPLYGAVILGSAGFALLFRSIAGLVAAGVIAVFFTVKARHEERRLERSYPEYAAYRRATPHRFVPWVW